MKPIKGKEISSSFPMEFNRGQIEIFSPPLEFYPEFEKYLPINSFGDSEQRILWRQKQNLGEQIV